MDKIKKGYFQHRNALVESDEIGDGTRIWAFAHVMKGSKVGKNCNIGEQCFIEASVVIGDNVVVKNGVAIWDGVLIEDGAFIGPNVAFTNEVNPRSGFPKEYKKTILRKGASIGANATIVAGVVIGRYATIGAGSVVTKDVDEFTLVYGNPAKPHGFVCLCGLKISEGDLIRTCSCGRRYRLENWKIHLIE